MGYNSMDLYNSKIHISTTQYSETENIFECNKGVFVFVG